jgi:hypothetical protein
MIPMHYSYNYIIYTFPTREKYEVVIIHDNAMEVVQVSKQTSILASHKKWCSLNYGNHILIVITPKFLLGHVEYV